MNNGKGRIPKYRLHKSSGRAVVTLNGRDIYLGIYGTASGPPGAEGGAVVWDALNQLQREGSLVDLKRERIESQTLRGFVTAVSAELVAIGLVNDECHFDGVTIVRTEDITFLRWQDDVLDAWAGVLQESPTSPTPVPHVELSSWESVVRSLLGTEPVVTFHREIVNDRVCHLGTNISIEGECVVADEISVEGTIDGRFALSLGDLTKVDFGGGYEKALWRMVQKTRK